MANHKSTEKRIRQTVVKNEKNKYYAKTMRNALKKLRLTTNREEADVMLPRLTSLLDRLVNKKIIHQNKASNLKSSLVKHVTSLQQTEK